MIEISDDSEFQIMLFLLNRTEFDDWACKNVTVFFKLSA